MAEFTLETGTVSSASSTLSSIASQVANIASSVSGWDTACEDFNFSGAKSSIASNISALEAKITNTAKIVEAVVQTHTQLQESMTFQGSGASSADSSTDATADSSTTSGTSTSGGSSYTTTGGSTSGGGYYPTTGGGTSSIPSTPTTKTTEPSTQAEVTVIVVELKDKVDSIGQQLVDTSSLTGDSKTIMDQVTYNEAGYAMINSMYVVACGTALGVIGDTIEMTLSNGEKLTCVVGINDDNLGNNINFVVNDQWKQEGEKNIPSNIKDQATKITNYHQDKGTSSTTTSTVTGATTAGKVSVAGLGQVGINTSTWSTLDSNWTVASTKTNLPSYASQIQGKVSQNANSSKYGDKCLSFAETHAYALYTGNTKDNAESASNYPHGNSFTSWYSDSKEETLKKIYSEIVQGRPVVVQVNGNKQGTSRHFVTVVGFNNSVADTQTISEKDLLIVDSWDGKVERMDQENSRFLTSGKDCGKSYSGYYLRVLKA